MKAHRAVSLVAAVFVLFGTILGCDDSGGGAGGGNDSTGLNSGTDTNSGTDSNDGTENDTTPPEITGLDATVMGSALVVVTWKTDEPANGTVECTDGTRTWTASHKEYTTSHEVRIGRLDTETTYTITVRSADEAGNESTAGPVEVTTRSIHHLLVRQGHPIMFVDDEVEALVRSKTEELAAFHEYVKSAYMKATDDPSDIETIRAAMDAVDDYAPRNLSKYYGIDAYFNNDPLARAYGIQLATALVEWEPTLAGGDAKVRTALYALGFLYDFLYDAMDSQLKASIRAKIIEILDFIDQNHGYVLTPQFDTHARLGNVCALIALLPIFHDISADSQELQDRYFYWLDRIVRNFRLYILPDQAYATAGGMNQMGWAYGTSYSSLDPYLAWNFAVQEESWLDEWQGQFFYSFLYGMRNTKYHWDNSHWDHFDYWGDVWGTFFYIPFQTEFAPLAGSHMFYDDPHARWFHTHLGLTDLMYRNINDLLYRDFDASDVQPPDDLPLSRLFPHSGYLVIRDSWDFDSDGPVIVFRSGDFYSFNHTHRDHNAFTVYYKGPLAIDSGGYNNCGAWGSTHWWNYYIRSVAHNTVLVYDPDEEFTYGSRHLSNDGGQRFFETGSPHLEQMAPGGENHLDGMVRYEDGGWFVYALGDATKAYSPHKMELFTRTFVVLRGLVYDHPAMVILDHVISKNPSFKKTYLLHSMEEPTVVGNVALVGTYSNPYEPGPDEAYLYQETVLPADPSIQVVGGDGQEYLVWDDGEGNPRNYVEDCSDTSYPPADLQRGAWRIEVSPSSDATEDWFLHVLSVTDAQEGASDPVDVQYFEGDGVRGVFLADPDGQDTAAVVFVDPYAPVDAFAVDLPQEASRVLITGLEPGASYDVRLEGASLSVAQGGSMSASDAGIVVVSP